MSLNELVRAIRLDIAGEHEATSLYQAHADATELAGNEPMSASVAYGPLGQSAGWNQWYFWSSLFLKKMVESGFAA